MLQEIYAKKLIDFAFSTMNEIPEGMREVITGFVILSPILKALGFHRRFCEILVIFDVKASVHNNSSPRWMRFTEGSCLYSFF